MAKKIAILVLFFAPLFVLAQSLQVKVNTSNPTDNAQDGEAVVEVTGGTPPYSYHWSGDEKPSKENKKTGLVENYGYAVVVSDASGTKANVEFKVAPNTFPERLNGSFKTATGGFVGMIFAEIPFSDTVKIPWVLILLLGGALFFTLTFKFAQFRLFGTSVKVVQGKYDDIDHHEVDPAFGDVTPGADVFETIAVEGAEGEVSHFQALTAALSATVGLGNIAGVAVALSIGGPGATFWMILAGLLGMASKFAECTLGVKYRDVDKDGVVYGGPMYYLTKGLKEKGMGGLGKVLAIIFAVMVVGGSFGGGNMFQANQASAQFIQLFAFENSNAGMYFGIVMALIVAVVIIGGIKRIASVTEKIVPFMAIIYVGAALIIIFMNFSLIPEAFGQIFSGAFSGEGIIGGFVGVMIQGFRRGTFSNEAGVGSAAIAHSAVRTKYPASEGIVALLEPFIDTVVICTMTALVLVITNIQGGFFEYGVKVSQGVQLTATAFDSAIPHFSYVLTIAVILFAFSTMISWSYYGMQGWKFLFGKGKITDLIYKILFLIFVVIGASISLGAVIDFSDAMIFAMVVPNIIGVILLTPKIKEELNRYLAAIKKSKSTKK